MTPKSFQITPNGAAQLLLYHVIIKIGYLSPDCVSAMIYVSYSELICTNICDYAGKIPFDDMHSFGYSRAIYESL